MDIYRENYAFDNYDNEEIQNFDYESSPYFLYFYPILYPSNKIHTVEFKNHYDVNFIRKHNLYYSLFFIVNKHIWSKHDFYNYDEDKFEKKENEHNENIKTAVKNKKFPSKYVALIYYVEHGKINYNEISDAMLKKIVNSIIYFANTLGILSSSKPSLKKNNFKLYSSDIIKSKLRALNISVQLKLFIEWISNKTLIITGSTGIGKSSLVPVLLFYIFHLFNGHSSNDFLELDKIELEKKMYMALPRILLVQSIGSGLINKMGLDITNNDLVSLQYKNISENKSYYNENKEYRFLIATTQSLFAYLNNASLIICDEVHEHSIASDNLISIARILNIQLVLISATIDSDKEVINKFFSNYSYIDIKGPPLYKIEEYQLDIINKTNYKNKNILIYKIINTILKYVKTLTQIGDTSIVFIPTKRWVTELYDKIKINNDIEFKILHKDVLNYDKEILEYFKNEKTRRHVIISTPIAESSISIEGLKLVIDTGLEYNINYEVSNIDFITYYSYIQRKGRVGRTAPGYYISLYNKDLLVKELKREIDGQRLFIPLLYLYHFLDYQYNKPSYRISPGKSIENIEDDKMELVEKNNVIITKEDIINNYIFPPKNINRIDRVYDYLNIRNFFNKTYTQLLMRGIACSIIDYLYIYEKYKDDDKIFNELKDLEDNSELTNISNTLFNEIMKLNKRFLFKGGIGYYLFFNDIEESFKVNMMTKLINFKQYKIIKYNKAFFRMP